VERDISGGTFSSLQGGGGGGMRSFRDFSQGSCRKNRRERDSEMMDRTKKGHGNRWWPEFTGTSLNVTRERVSRESDSGSCDGSQEFSIFFENGFLGGGE